MSYILQDDEVATCVICKAPKSDVRRRPHPLDPKQPEIEICDACEKASK